MAAYNLMNNPEASISKNGFDLFAHGLTFISLSENAEDITQLAAAFINIARSGGIVELVNSGCSGLPLPVNVIDFFIHVFSAAVLLRPEQGPQGAALTS